VNWAFPNASTSSSRLTHFGIAAITPYKMVAILQPRWGESSVCGKKLLFLHSRQRGEADFFGVFG
jgi:hypothetical protein